MGPVGPPSLVAPSAKACHPVVAMRGPAWSLTGLLSPTCQPGMRALRPESLDIRKGR